MYQNRLVVLLMLISSTFQAESLSTRLHDPTRVPFFLYNQRNSTRQPLLPKNVLPNSKFFVISHAYIEDSTERWVLLLRFLYLRNHPDCNIILVDYGYYAYRDYLTSMYSVPFVGDLLEKAIESLGTAVLIDECVGFSLGAHICGFSSRYMKKTNRFKRIIGLEAADPGFDRFAVVPLEQLRSGDADLVIGYYSSGSYLGFGALVTQPDADYNVVVNNGQKQPACNLLNLNFNMFDKRKWVDHFFCDHIFVRNILLNIENGTIYEAPSCDNHYNYIRGLCNDSDKLVLIRIMEPTVPFGTYYLPVDKNYNQI